MGKINHSLEPLRIPLDPYPCSMYLSRSKDEYNKMVEEIFGEKENLIHGVLGSTYMSKAIDGDWKYLVYAKSGPELAHELSHVILEEFDRCGINPIASRGEPFCYMLSSLLAKCNKILRLKGERCNMACKGKGKGKSKPKGGKR